ncbi:MAG: hypothetical protein ACW99A_06025 [Candidatus Kariarchaeaceae archaeon]|jgi:hypothetical protein
MVSSSEGKNLISQLLDDEIVWEMKFEIAHQIKNPENIEIGMFACPEPEIRLILLEKIEDRKLLEKVARTDDDPLIRQRSLNMLPNSYHELFIDLIKEDTSLYVRFDALNKLPAMYQELFIEVLIKEEEFRVRKLAREKLRLTELSEDKITNLAINAWDNIVRLAAIRYIKNENNLYQVALHSGDYRVGESAVDEIRDNDILKKISSEAEFAHVRAKSAMRIDDQNFLAELFKKDESKFVREVCIERISDIEILAALRLIAAESLQKDIVHKINKIKSRKY